jgi:uncharacterized linocin/CFP29 family protein
VRDEKVSRKPGEPVKVVDNTTLRLFNLTVPVELSSEQVNEEGLSSAVLAFSRAANLLGLSEDHIIFNGHGTSHARQRPAPPAFAIVKSAPDSSHGLAERRHPVVETGRKKRGEDPTEVLGQVLVKAVVRAINELEEGSHPGPFACVLGNTLFEAAHTPREKSMVLPADRIVPLLKGSLFRCGRLDPDRGVVASLGGNDIDIVVATPPRAQFLQVTPDAKFMFRVYEKFTLRIKDETAVKLLQINLA